MFWKKTKQFDTRAKGNFPHPYRFCHLYITDKYREILFVPFGKINILAHAEVDNIVVDSWPCEFGKLQKNIELTLNEYRNSTEYVKGNWPSFKKSKAKSQSSFETDYIRVILETDTARNYGEKEVERIKVSAQPSVLTDTFSLVGCGHLLDTKIAQIVIDIVDGCFRIRNN